MCRSRRITGDLAINGRLGSAEQRVPKGHPLRAIRGLVDDVLREMSREFDRLFARVGAVDSA